MRTKLLTFILIILLCDNISIAQGILSEDPTFNQELIESGLLHIPLPLDYSKSFEAIAEKKEVLHTEPLCQIQPGLPGWKHSGLGNMVYSNDKSISGSGSIKVEYPATSYTEDIKSFVDFNITNPDWRRFNRVSFWVYPDCEGARIVHMSLLLHNDGKIKIPYDFNREGSHYINLKNQEWNHVLLEIDENGRDNVSRFAFSFPAFGQERTMMPTMRYYVDKIELQQIEEPEKTVGWQPGNNRLVYSTTGYAVGSEKTAIVNMDRNLHKGEFRLINARNNQTAYTSTIKQVKTTTGTFDVLDFTSFDQPGEYQLSVGDLLTPSFRISERLWENSLWRVTNFFFGERCGFDVPTKHASCHLDIFAEHDGKKIMYAGGWHDAGDESQQTLQTAEIAYYLLEGYNKYKNQNKSLALRMLEEARWGLDFVLRCRFGDGYRVSSVGNILWTDGIIGTPDDLVKGRVTRSAFDNFLYAGIEAYAAMSIDRDPMLQDYLKRIAREDFDLAMEDHAKTGYIVPRGGGHTLNTPESQYMATISWTASMLYQLTGEQHYANLAAEYIRYTLDCQRKEPLSKKSNIKGFFYRDKTHKVAVHYNHQSRDQFYMQALTLLCETQPNHPEHNKWVESIALYGDYLKSIMAYTAPYGMVPSGVYRLDEFRDPSFETMHPYMKVDDQQQNYIEQVKSGAPLDKEHYLKRFPVWFSFRGNAAVHLATGKAAALCGKFLNDKELLQIGQEQLYWLTGKNPFGQSLVYGEGHNYAQQFAVCPGELVGEVPVGIQTRLNGDEPCWPYTSNSTYREVWGAPAGKWISLAVEY